MYGERRPRAWSPMREGCRCDRDSVTVAAGARASNLIVVFSVAAKCQAPPLSLPARDIRYTCGEHQGPMSIAAGCIIMHCYALIGMPNAAFGAGAATPSAPRADGPS